MAVAVKPLPACHFTHACSDAAIALLEQHKLAIGDIERIKALVPAEVVKTVCEPVANKRRPANAYDAQFSIPYLVAASLVRGRFGLAELEPEVLSDERILRPVRPRRLRGRPQVDLPAALHGRGADLAQGRPHAGAPRGHEPRLRRPPADECRDRREVRGQRAPVALGAPGRRGPRGGARARCGTRRTRRSSIASARRRRARPGLAPSCCPSQACASSRSSNTAPARSAA